MKEVNKRLKVIALFLSALIFLQSCSSYKTPGTLQDAVEEEKSVKIVTVDDDTYKYKYIVYENGEFFGVKDNPREDVKFPINKDEVVEVMMKKGGIPVWAWILMSLGIVFVVLMVAYLIDPGPTM